MRYVMFIAGIMMLSTTAFAKGAESISPEQLRSRKIDLVRKAISRSPVYNSYNISFERITEDEITVELSLPKGRCVTQNFRFVRVVGTDELYARQDEGFYRCKPKGNRVESYLIAPDLESPSSTVESAN